MRAQRIQRSVESGVICVAGDHCLGARLVDDAGGCPFFLCGILDVAKAKDQRAALARCERKIKLLRGNGLPAVGDASGAAGAEDGLRPGGAAVHAHESVPRGVEAVGLPVRPEDSVVIAPLTIFCLVIDRRTHDLHLAGGIVALEVGAVVHGVPEAEFHVGEKAQLFFFGALIANADAHEQAVVPLRDEELLADCHAVLCPFDHGIAQAVAAKVRIQLLLHRLPARIPDRPVVLYIDMKAFGIQGTVVVTIARKTAKPCVAEKGVAPRGIGAERKKGFAAQVVDPGQGRARRGDHVLPARIVKISELHACLLKKTFKFLLTY